MLDQVAALADQGWGKGVMTMVGDAAHSMRPTGQGVNTALEDAVVLASHLQRGGLNAGSLRSFERERIPRVSTIAQQEYVNPMHCACSSMHCAIQAVAASYLDSVMRKTS